jgi:hypothetical protein
VSSGTLKAIREIRKWGKEIMVKQTASVVNLIDADISTKILVIWDY